VKILPEPVSFEWDKGNSDKNWIKHKVSRPEIEEVFTNEPLLVSEDTKHSQKELSIQALGQTDNDRRLFLSLTIRGEKIRIISARDMNKREEVAYEKA
jgi:uncharacterized protein